MSDDSTKEPVSVCGWCGANLPNGFDVRALTPCPTCGFFIDPKTQWWTCKEQQERRRRAHWYLIDGKWHHCWTHENTGSRYVDGKLQEISIPDTFAGDGLCAAPDGICYGCIPPEGCEGCEHLRPVNPVSNIINQGTQDATS